MTDFVLIASGGAGGADDEVVAAVAAALGGADVVPCAAPSDLDTALDRLGGRRVAIAGGDGSVHALVNALARRGELGTPVGLIPLGTGNDLARALDLPLEPAAAAEVVRTGTPRALDLLVDDTGLHVVNAVHLGVGADAAEKASGLKRRLGPLAYPVGAVAAGVRARGEVLTVEVDGRRVSEGRRLLMVGVINARTIGGGTPVAPDGTPDDGRADVILSAAVGPVARLAYAVALRAGRHPERSDVRSLTAAREVSVDTGAVEVGVNADGELSRLRGRRTWRVVPGAWSVLTA